MDLNQDGFIDVLSGSFSGLKSGGPQVGLFYLLAGKDGGGFAKAEPLRGSDEELLIIQSPSEVAEEQMCTRAFAADLDDDGYLDLVAGNRAGSFAIFFGEEGGAFDPMSSWLTDDSDKPLSAGHYSDPFLVDWDADGDLDLLSGCDEGGVWLFANGGTKTKAAFAAGRRLVYPPTKAGEGIRFGEAHLTGPQGSTRVAAADVDGDGKLDLLIGDTTTITRPADELTELECLEKMKVWQAKVDAIQAERPELDESDESWEIFDAWQSRRAAVYRKRSEFMSEVGTGSVWLLRGK